MRGPWEGRSRCDPLRGCRSSRLWCHQRIKSLWRYLGYFNRSKSYSYHFGRWLEQRWKGKVIEKGRKVKETVRKKGSRRKSGKLPVGMIERWWNEHAERGPFTLARSYPYLEVWIQQHKNAKKSVASKRVGSLFTRHEVSTCNDSSNKWGIGCNNRAVSYWKESVAEYYFSSCQENGGDLRLFLRLIR